VRADVADVRESQRQRRLRHLASGLLLVAGWLWFRLLVGAPAFPGVTLSPELRSLLPALVLVVLLGAVVVLPVVGAGRSPHVLYRSSEIGIGMDDVRGAGVVRE
jgi:cell division protease FtsH